MRRQAPAIAAAAVAAGGAAVLLVAGRGTWFYLDEWDFSLRAAHLTADSVFTPQNQNFHATVVLVYRALFDLFGFDSYVPFRLLSTGLVVLVGLLGYIYASRRIGPWWGLLVLALLVLTSSYEVVVWPFQVGQLISAAAGLATLLLLDREPTRAAWIGAGALLVVAVASSSVGVPVVALVLYDRLLTRGRRSEALVALPAIIVYAWWYAEYASREPRPNQFNAPALSAAADLVVTIGDGAVESLLGLTSQGAKGLLVGQVGFAVLVVVVCWRVFGAHSVGRPRVIALAGALVTYWCLLAWGRGPQGGGLEVSGRYLFLSQILLVLLLVEVAVGVAAWLRDEPARGRRGLRAGSLVAGLAITLVASLALLHNARTILDFGGFLRLNARAMRGQVYGLFLLPQDRRAAAAIFLEALGPQIQRSAGPYFLTLEQFGAPTADEADVRALPADGRGRADLALFTNYLLPQPAPAPGGEAPEITVLADGEVRMRVAGPCVTVRAASEAPVTFALPPSVAGTAITNLGKAPLTVRARRYASDWTGPAKADVPADGSLAFAFPADRGSSPWEVRIAAEAARVCSLG